MYRIMSKHTNKRRDTRFEFTLIQPVLVNAWYCAVNFRSCWNFTWATHSYLVSRVYFRTVYMTVEKENSTIRKFRPISCEKREKLMVLWILFLFSSTFLFSRRVCRGTYSWWIHQLRTEFQFVSVKSIVSQSESDERRSFHLLFCSIFDLIWFDFSNFELWMVCFVCTELWIIHFFSLSFSIYFIWSHLISHSHIRSHSHSCLSYYNRMAKHTWWHITFNFNLTWWQIQFLFDTILFYWFPLTRNSNNSEARQIDVESFNSNGIALKQQKSTYSEIFHSECVRGGGVGVSAHAHCS